MTDLRSPRLADAFATLLTLTAAACDRPGPQFAPARTRRHGWWERFEAWAWRARQRDLERALSNATDAVDLERRLRMAERALGGRPF